MKIRGFEVCKGYEDKDINLPVRKTRYSAAYDLEAAEDTIIPSIWKIVFNNIKKFISGDKNYDEIKPTFIPTGLCSYFGEDEVLIIANKSSFPLKKGLVMSNSIGVIDSDYYMNENNYGHIMLTYYNFSFKDTIIKKGEPAGQAYFQKFLIADNDNACDIRKGGFGSTSK